MSRPRDALGQSVLHELRFATARGWQEALRVGTAQSDVTGVRSSGEGCQQFVILRMRGPLHGQSNARTASLR